MDETGTFADLGKLQGILKNSKMVLEKTKDRPRNKNVPNTKGLSDADRELGPMVEASPSVMTESYNSYAPDAGGGNLDWQFSEQVMAKSKLPKEVLEVMKESSKERQKLESSVSSNLDPKLIASINSNKKPQTITEAPKQQYNNGGGSVDYEVIKMIVEGCMKKYTANLKKTLMTESKGSTLELMTQQGNTFRFVTSDGKIFEGKLTYKGNLKEK